MPSLADKYNAPVAAEDTLRLPAKLPVVPAEVLKRFQTMGTYQDDMQKWWTTTNRRLTDMNRENATVLNKAATNSASLIKVLNGFRVEIDDINDLIITSEQALARKIISVSAIASSSAHIRVQNTAPGSPVLNDLWVDTSTPTTPITYRWNGTAWVEETVPVSAAAVQDERVARITSDGFLEGKYTLTVAAGNVVTGMNITSSTGSGTLISSVIFRASDFLIYDGTTGLQTFSISGGKVTLANTFVVDALNSKVYIGTGTYNNSGTFFYLDSAGRFSLKDKLTWDGTTLTVSGNINVVSISGLNYAGSTSPGGAANTIVGQGTLATLSSVNYNTQLTFQPTNSAGQLIIATSPSGTGLFLGNDHLGYYTGGAWRTFMDSSGNFYLGGTSGSLQWNGTTLTIVGGGTFSGALSAATGTFSGSLSAATGTFSGTLSVGTGAHRTVISSSQATFGDSSGVHFQIDDLGTQIYFSMYDGGSRTGFIAAKSAGGSRVSAVDIDSTNGGFTNLSYTGASGNTMFANSYTGGSVTITGNIGAGSVNCTGIVSSGNISGAEFYGNAIHVQGSGQNIYIDDGAIQKSSPGGWGPYFYDGNYLIELQFDGTHVNARINGGSVIQLG